MKHSWIRSKRGLTLFEVILACVIFPAIIFSGTSILMGMARVSDKTNTGMDFLMKMDTVFLRVEEDLLNVTAADPYPQVAWGSGYVELQLSATLKYRYTIGTRALTLVNGATTSTLSTGILLPDAPLEDYDKSGGIDSTDTARRETCLTTQSQAACQDLKVSFVFGVATDQNRLDFSFRSERQQENDQHGFTKSIPLAK